MSNEHKPINVLPAPETARCASARTVVNVHIGEIMLTDLPLTYMQATRLRMALQLELEALLAARDLPARLRSGGSEPSLPGAALHVAQWRNAGDLGRQIAQALHGGLQR